MALPALHQECGGVDGRGHGRMNGFLGFAINILRSRLSISSQMKRTGPFGNHVRSTVPGAFDWLLNASEYVWLLAAIY
ncbi:hypothetical protein N7468_002018 [Penicillium chermesinum]|uniref:Uncharacterized protein n=1 Tax=Penicillium chermesinum TaxID=63820 RepID=A0A9W9PHU1_9EURO|nr:uncharacterized protein N7468_002018 [Penicillium chermesinum]KAJ5247035.1 hypothetical protein N7468_002018 [Penicillium chermesinum]KAJ6145283.1 hypothetical protein N7470_009178 [Penicillium chermesinum]